RELLRTACRQLEIDPEIIPSLILEFLLIRTHYHRAHDEPEMEQIFIHLLRLGLENADRLAYHSHV
ncbi:MAG: hypothetical protein ACRD10_06935, partial [Terriglobia bacterium]